MTWTCEIIDGYNRDKWLRFKKGTIQKDLHENDFRKMIEAYIKMKTEHIKK
jgi:hypothetical protein